MATPRLSKEAETKITDSLSEVAELVNSGCSPNEALAKTASSNGVPVGHLELMVRAYNTGRSETQRQAGSDPLEKLAEFELADLKTVIDTVYPDRVKTAASLLRDTLISEAYRRAPEPEKVELKPLTKLAADKGAYRPMDQDGLGHTRTISSLIEKIGRNSEKLRADSSQSKDRMMDGINKLASYFRTFGGKPFTVVQNNSVRLFGKKAEALLNILSSSNKSFKKQAGTVADIAAPVELKAAPYNLIHGCIKSAEIHLNKAASVNYLKKVISSAISSAFSDSLPVEYTGSVLDGMDKKAAGPSMPQSVTLASRAKDTWEAARPRESNVGDEIKEYGFRNDQLAQDMMLKNIRASAAISDLMANDDIIGAHHPEDVAMHFNEISNISPDSSTNTSIMRPLLRKRLEGGNAAIDPTDVQQMLDIENTRSDTSSLRKDVMSRGSSQRSKKKEDDKK
jgi:hypothetical protein